MFVEFKPSAVFIVLMYIHRGSKRVLTISNQWLSDLTYSFQIDRRCSLSPENFWLACISQTQMRHGQSLSTWMLYTMLIVLGTSLHKRSYTIHVLQKKKWWSPYKTDNLQRSLFCLQAAKHFWGGQTSLYQMARKGNVVVRVSSVWLCCSWWVASIIPLTIECLSPLS